MFNTIASRVRKHMSQKIKEAEEKHRLHCVEVDQEARQKKEAHADKLVESLVNNK